MKKTYVMIGVVLAIFGASHQLTGSDKNWMRNKIDVFTKNMLRRHTYQYHSFEHYRDLGVLCVLPMHVSQNVLKQQRENMVQVMYKNEEKGLENVKNYFGIDDDGWSDIKGEIDMWRGRTMGWLKDKEAIGFCDDDLPQEWVSAISNECLRYGINPSALKLKSKKEHTYIAATKIRTIFFNVTGGAVVDPDCYTLQHAATHEMVHLARSDYLRRDIIALAVDNRLNGLSKKHFELNTQLEALKESDQLSQKSDDQAGIESKMDRIAMQYKKLKKLRTHFGHSVAQQSFHDAQEKIADTLVACTDSKAAINAFHATKTTGYANNHNDMKVIYANWQATKAIGNTQQFFQSSQKKLQQFFKRSQKL